MEITNIPVSELYFDQRNPRLPMDLLGGSPTELATYYYEEDVVRDLIASMLENGFFPHEPLIVRPREEGGYIVAEGNRRLAALLAIHDHPAASEIPKPSPTPSREQLGKLIEVPCVIAEDEAAIRKFIGFRHISGPRTWGPEAKARFVVEEIETAIEAKVEHPFRKVAAAVGTNVQTVRDAFVAVRLLLKASEETSFDVSQVQSKRFGVWLRVISSPGVQDHIGFKLSTSFENVVESLNNVNLDKLVEVLSDLSAHRGEKPILFDSRDASSYGQVLSNAIAYETLRKTQDLSAAATIVQKESLPTRIRSEARRIEALSEEVRATDYNNEVEEAAKHLASEVRTLLKLSKPDEEDDLFD